MMRVFVGHRGFPKEYPGNTMRGFQRAIELGCAMVECDVRLSADGEVVLAHDPQVRTSDGATYVVAECKAAELAQLDLGSGQGVVLLRELVAWANGRCGVMADMKCEDEGVQQRVAELLSPLERAAKVVPGAGAESRRRFREIDPELPLSLTLAQHDARWLDQTDFESFASGLDTEAVTWEHPLLTRARIEVLHRNGRTVYAWTVDDPEIMARLLDAGVDGVITNRADLVRRGF